MNTKFSFCLLLLVAACSGGGKPADGPSDGAAPPPSATATATANATSTDTTPKATEGNPAGDCGGKTCGSGESCVSYYGVAGPRGPQFHDCVIPCKRGSANDGCPEGKRCTTIADGPGDVCQ